MSGGLVSISNHTHQVLNDPSWSNWLYKYTCIAANAGQLDSDILGLPLEALVGGTRGRCISVARDSDGYDKLYGEVVR